MRRRSAGWGNERRGEWERWFEGVAFDEVPWILVGMWQLGIWNWIVSVCNAVFSFMLQIVVARLEKEGDYIHTCVVID